MEQWGVFHNCSFHHFFRALVWGGAGTRSGEAVRFFSLSIAFAMNYGDGMHCLDG
jgi:hypothetical protein